MSQNKTRYQPRHAWYLADALLLVRTLQAIMWPMGYHVALGGGVLNHGYSDKDVDLYVLPLGKTLAQPAKDVLDALTVHFGELPLDYGGTPETVQEFELLHGKGSWDQNTFFAHSVCYSMANGSKVDVFIIEADRKYIEEGAAEGQAPDDSDGWGAE